MAPKTVLLLLTISVTFVIGLAGCARLGARRAAQYRTTEQVAIGDSLAKDQHQAAICLMNQGLYGPAEQRLQEALLTDAGYGPAHNTLGKLYYDQQKFYLASWEFEHAAKAMPNRAEPLNNLGLVHESVEKIDLAVDFYQRAFDISPTNATYLGNLLRARIRRGDKTTDMIDMFQQLIHMDERLDWMEWAKLQMVKIEDDRVGLRASHGTEDGENYVSEMILPLESEIISMDVSPGMPNDQFSDNRALDGKPALDGRPLLDEPRQIERQSGSQGDFIVEEPASQEQAERPGAASRVIKLTPN